MKKFAANLAALQESDLNSRSFVQEQGRLQLRASEGMASAMSRHVMPEHVMPEFNPYGQLGGLGSYPSPYGVSGSAVRFAPASPYSHSGHVHHHGFPQHGQVVRAPSFAQTSADAVPEPVVRDPVGKTESVCKQGPEKTADEISERTRTLFEEMMCLDKARQEETAKSRERVTSLEARIKELEAEVQTQKDLLQEETGKNHRLQGEIMVSEKKLSVFADARSEASKHVARLDGESKKVAETVLAFFPASLTEETSGTV